MNTKEKLTAFLKREKEMLRVMLQETVTEGYYNGDENWIKDHDKELINFVLDIVGEEIEKKKYKVYEHTDSMFIKGNHQAFDDIKQILTNLKK